MKLQNEFETALWERYLNASTCTIKFLHAFESALDSRKRNLLNILPQQCLLQML